MIIGLGPVRCRCFVGRAAAIAITKSSKRITRPISVTLERMKLALLMIFQKIRTLLCSIRIRKSGKLRCNNKLNKNWKINKDAKYSDKLARIRLEL